MIAFCEQSNAPKTSTEKTRSHISLVIFSIGAFQMFPSARPALLTRKSTLPNFFLTCLNSASVSARIEMSAFTAIDSLPIFLMAVTTFLASASELL